VDVADIRKFLHDSAPSAAYPTAVGIAMHRFS